MRKSRRIFLERKVAELEILIASNSDNQIHKECDQCKMELETLYDYITAGLIESHLRKIITDSNTEISDPSEIVRHVKHFYSALYKRRSTKNEKECLEYPNGLNLPKLKDSEREVCEGLITRRECWDALNAIKNGKSPGNEGLR